METEKLADLALKIGYLSLITGTITAGVAWAMTRIQVIIKWQKNVMEKTINNLFQSKISPQLASTYVRKDDCLGMHKITDINIMAIRAEISDNSKKLDILLEHVLRGMA